MIDEDAAPPLMVGAVLRERYRVERMLDADSTRRRYLIADPATGRTLILHQYLPSWIDPDGDAEIGGWFAAAATRWAALGHSCIAPIRDHWSALDAEAGALYLAVDQVPGLSLAEELLEAGGRLRIQQALDWAIAIGDPLVYLHGQGLTFGQIRPARFVLDARHDTPVLVDFGFGQALTATAGDHWGYVPFEQLIGRTEPRSDLYALG